MLQNSRFSWTDFSVLCQVFCLLVPFSLHTPIPEYGETGRQSHRIPDSL